MNNIKLENLKNLNSNLVKLAVDYVEKTPFDFTGLVLASSGDAAVSLGMEKISLEITKQFKVLLNWTMGGIDYFCDVTGEFL